MELEALHNTARIENHQTFWSQWKALMPNTQVGYMFWHLLLMRFPPPHEARDAVHHTNIDTLSITPDPGVCHRNKTNHGSESKAVW